MVSSYKMASDTLVIVIWWQCCADVYLLRPWRGAAYCYQCVISVCPLAYLKNYMSKHHKIFCAGYLCLWLSRPM